MRQTGTERGDVSLQAACLVIRGTKWYSSGETWEIGALYRGDTAHIMHHRSVIRCQCFTFPETYLRSRDCPQDLLLRLLHRACRAPVDDYFESILSEGAGRFEADAAGGARHKGKLVLGAHDHRLTKILRDLAVLLMRERHEAT